MWPGAQQAVQGIVRYASAMFTDEPLDSLAHWPWQRVHALLSRASPGANNVKTSARFCKPNVLPES